MRREPVWLLLPEWLASVYQLDGGHQPRDQRFLNNILWGQFSAFLATKIQDDLFDEQLADRSLVWIADEFLLEAQRVFAVHFMGSKRFWDFYGRAIRTTVRAINLVDQCQSCKMPRYRTIARLYPSMYAVCNIATQAVCLRAGRPEHFQKASEFLDELTLTGQLLDDLEDIGDDLERGRVNAAAAFLAPKARPNLKGNLREIGHAMLHTNALHRLFQLLHRHVRRAGKAIQFLKHPELTQFLKSYGESLKALEEYFDGLKTSPLTAQYCPPAGKM